MLLPETHSLFGLLPAALLLMTACTPVVPNAQPPTSTPAPTLASPAWAPAPRTKATGCASRGGLPDPECTPGAVDPRVSQAAVDATICTSGYARSVRPPSRVTDQIKREEMQAYGLARRPAEAYELDHLIPLELGGAPADMANLWPEPRSGETNATMKDAVEVYLHDQVCRGAVLLIDAQRDIATDWLSVYRAKHLAGTPVGSPSPARGVHLGQPA